MSKEELNKQIAWKIKIERIRQNLSQKQLIEKSGLNWTRQIVSKIERGHRCVDVWELVHLARALETTTVELIAA